MIIFVLCYIKSIIMGILTSLYSRKERKEAEAKEALEDFMTLIRVYYQSVMAMNLGITNIRMLPDLTTYKRMFQIPTQGKLGQGERAHTKKLLMQNYGMSENFFKEIDNSMKKNCRTQNEINPYMYIFQDFSNTLFMFVGNVMKWKFAMPNFMNKYLLTLIRKTVHDIVTKTMWKGDGVAETAHKLRLQKEKLGHSEEWMAEYVSKVVMVSKLKRK